MATETINSTLKVKEGEKIISSVGMVVALISFGMLFLTLMLGFALFRFTAPVWPPAGMIRPGLMLPTISTIFIVLSSITFFLYEKNIKEKKYLITTLILGLAFMVAQTFFWSELKGQGIFVSSGVFASIIYSFTWVHAVHIVAALGLLVWLFREVNDESRAQLRAFNVGKFWHFLGIVWLIMFVTLFVL